MARNSSSGKIGHTLDAQNGEDDRQEEQRRTQWCLDAHDGEDGRQEEQGRTHWCLDAQYGRASAEVISVVQVCKEERWTLHMHEASLAGPTFHDGA